MINLTGLAVGLAGSFIILIFVTTELSYDKFNEKREHIYRVITDQAKHNMITAQTPFVLAPTLKKDFPGIQKFARTYLIDGVSVIKNKELFNEQYFQCADNDIFDIFTIRILKGNQANIIKAPNTVVISEKVNKKYFPGEDPLDKTLEIDHKGKRRVLKVTGIFKDLPKTSTFKADFIANIDLALEEVLIDMVAIGNGNFDRAFLTDHWGANMFTTYLLLEKNYPVNDLTQKLPEFEENYHPNHLSVCYSLQAMKDFYLRSSHLTTSFVPRVI